MLVTVAYSQSSGKVKYKFYVPLNIEKVPSQEAKNFISKMVEYANKQEFEMTFNKLQSKFLYIEKLSHEPNYEHKVNNIARTAFTSPDTYTDIYHKKQVLIMNDGNTIESKIENKNWEITTESKNIGDYLCYKAIQKIPFVDRKGVVRTKEIIAWFAPSLPYSYGPKISIGLPGLVLEHTEDGKTFIATKIELFNKKVEIDFPKGKTIPKEEYERKLEASMGGVIIGKKREKEKNSQ